MSVQVRSDNSTVPFVRYSYPLVKDQDAILLTDAGRTVDLAPHTLMAKVAASQKWVPFTDETATDGTAIPQGIYQGDAIPFADIVAGDVLDRQIIRAGSIVDEDQLIIENSKTLETVITVGTTDLRTVRDHLTAMLLVPRETINASDFENA